MKKGSIITAVAILLAACSCACLKKIAIPTKDEMLRTAVRSVVQVETPTGWGSGTIVFTGPGGNLVLTCEHVTHGDPPDSFFVRTYDGRRIAAHLYAADEKRDLALLFLPDEQYPWIREADLSDMPQRYQTVYVLAAPFLVKWSASEAFIADMDYRFDDGDFARAGAHVWKLTGGFGGPGASGGAILDSHGHLVCVEEAGERHMIPPGALMPLTQVGYCIPLADIKGFFAEHGL